jgi:hypothetical protein
VDGRDHEGWARTFTEDGSFSSRRLGTCRGFEALRKFAADYHEQLGGVQPRHIVTNISLKIDGDEARGMSYLSYYHVINGKVELAALGGYRDTMRKVDGHWLFASRDTFLDSVDF